MDVKYLLRKLDAQELKPEEQYRAAEVVRTLLVDIKVACEDLQQASDHRNEVLKRTVRLLGEHLPKKQGRLG
jgi:hypothetical protein